LTEFPHIIAEALAHAAVTDDELFTRDSKRDQLITILRNLQQLKWERVDVYFTDVFGHEKIVDKRSLPFLKDNGSDVVTHVAQIFLPSKATAPNESPQPSV